MANSVSKHDFDQDKEQIELSWNHAVLVTRS